MSAQSLRRRLTLTSLVVVTGSMALMGWGLLFAVRHAAWAQNDRALLARARALTTLVEYDEHRYEFESYRAAGSALQSVGAPIYSQVWHPDGSVLARSESLGAHDLPRLPAMPEAPVFQPMTLPSGERARQVSIVFVPRTEPESMAGAQRHRPEALMLALAESTAEVDRTLITIQWWFLILASGSIASAVLTTAIAIRRGLNPLDRLATGIGEIRADRLSRRLDASEQPSELQPPVRKLNELLARLERSFEREKRFTADASHELRTPLAGLRTLLEVTSLRERPPEEYRRAIATALVSVGHLSGVVEALLVLARQQTTQVPSEITTFELRPLVEECWNESSQTAEARRVVFRNQIDSGVSVCTDRPMLRLVLRNLMSNASEYTEEGGWVEVSAGQNRTLIEVTDSGPPIAPEHLERIFDRLWRADTVRTSTGAHTGVGLALVRDVCTAIGWEVTAENLENGAVRFRVSVAEPEANP